METQVAPGNAGMFVISVAAELAGMHPQTLRQYDRLGLVTPERAKGRGRRYSHADVERLREIQRLSQEEGINLAGIRRIIALKDELADLKKQVQGLNQALEYSHERITRIFAADRTGAISAKNPRKPRRGEMINQTTMLSAIPTSILQLMANSVSNNLHSM